jgi:hypothetical protein
MSNKLLTSFLNDVIYSYRTWYIQTWKCSFCLFFVPVKILNRLEERHNSYPLVCRRPAETVSLKWRQICYRWGTPACWSLGPRSSMFYLTTLPHDKLKTRLKETIHTAFSHRNYGSKFVVLDYNSTYFSNKIQKGKTCYYEDQVIMEEILQI